MARAGAQLPDVPPACRNWLDGEQAINERIVNPRVHAAIEGKGHEVPAPYRPEDRHVWPLDVVWMPRAQTRAYGFPETQLTATLGVRPPRGKLPMFVHPQSRRLYRDAVAAHGLARSALAVTPTSSFRSLLAWSADGRAAVLKVSLGATIGRVHRRLREDQIARAVLVNQVLDAIPEADHRAVGLSWFSEIAGVVDARRGNGWLLRMLPPALRESHAGALLPAFSLISRRGEREPLLVELVRRAPERPELFVTKRLLVPYVNALAFLLLGEGIEFEGHMQNVLYEVGVDGDLTGHVVLRDLSDASINVALRVARGKPLPRPRHGFFPPRAPFSYVSNAADFRVNARRPVVRRASDTVDRYGLGSFVWAVNHSLARFFPGYSARAVEHAYLHLWQRAVVGYLGVMPLHRPRQRGRLTGIAIDEAVAHYLEHTDWASLGARAASLPASGAEPLLITARALRRVGRGYRRIAGTWGDLFIDGTRPAFLRPAF